MPPADTPVTGACGAHAEHIKQGMVARIAHRDRRRHRVTRQCVDVVSARSLSSWSMVAWRAGYGAPRRRLPGGFRWRFGIGELCSRALGIMLAI